MSCLPTPSRRHPPSPVVVQLSLASLCTAAIIICYADRTNIATAVLSMSDDYHWDSFQQGVVLSSFYWGYMVAQIPAGWLAKRFGGFWLLLLAVFLWSLFTFITPIAAASGYYVLLLCRVLMGIGEGMSFPACHHLISVFIVKKQQSTTVGIITAGSYIGTVIANFTTPKIITVLSWPFAFYIFGAIGFIWCIIAAYFQVGLSWFSEDTRVIIDRIHFREPVSDQFELTVVEENGSSLDDTPSATVEMETSNDPNNTVIHDNSADKKVPWILLLKCKQVWAIIINQFCQSWGFYILLNWIPEFYKDVYKVEMNNLGIYLILPYAIQGIVGIVVGWLADILISSKRFSTVQVRRIFQIPGMVLPALFLLLLIYVTTNTTTAMLLLTCSLGANALTLAGVSAYQLDFAPKYAGVIFGMGNTAGTFAGLVGVFVTGILLEIYTWYLVFWLAVGMFLFGAASWLVLARGHTGPLPELDIDVPSHS